MQQFLEFMLGSIAALFPVVDPIGGVPIFLVLTPGASKQLRWRFARKTAIYVILVLIFFVLVGGAFLRFFRISLEVVRIAGGIVVFHAAWQTMNAKPRLTASENQEAALKVDHHEDISFLPMTIPMLAGPGSIAVTLGLSAQAGRDLSVETALNLIAVSVAIILIGAVIYISLRSSTLLLRMLGESGIHAISRLLGLFVMAVGVQLILNGLADWLSNLRFLQSFQAL
ncbi:MAG: MarC family protein [Elainellaceae cyanobacterium]